MKPKLKICGMREAQNISEVASLSPDFMGFIFYKKSKRFVGDDFEIPSGFPKQIKRVGVFVNEETEVILNLAKRHGLDFAQLHGGESVSQCEQLKQKEIGVIKVFSIHSGFDFSEVKPFASCVDYFLFDTRTEGFGGSGKSFDWSVLDRYAMNVPFFLSGGLSLENIGIAMKLKNPGLYALDINSGVEVSPGLKDIKKIQLLKEFIKN